MSLDDLKPRTPAEVYRLEKLKRGQSVRPHPLPSKRRPPPAATYLLCPKCRSEKIALGFIGGRKRMRRRARCLECEYRWWTTSIEAFGGTRQVEVRG